jgi:hypothetical protein
LQGVDWRDPSITRRACNGELNPLQPGFNDGISVEPLEVMFIKVRGGNKGVAGRPRQACACSGALRVGVGMLPQA